MATGNPIKKALLNSEVFTLSYSGKENKQDILQREPSKLIDHVEKSAEGHLFWGDNLPILLSLLKAPEINGKVDLVYIDPPFASGASFVSRKQSNAYADNLSGATYIEYLRKRLVVLYELLSDRGSLYLHLDSRMVFPVKVILDEVFGESNFRNFIVRQKSNPKNYTRKSFGNIADYILFYTKTDDYIWNKQTEKLSDDQLKEYRYVDEKGRRHMRVPLHAPGVRNGSSGEEWRGIKPPIGKHWQYKPDTLEQLDQAGHIHWSTNGNPRKKVYLDENLGKPVQDIWMNFKDAHNQNISITGYPTEKNPEMMERIIRASSNEGSIVLDCFAGSGTTLDIAGKMKRFWIGIDSSFEAIQTISRRIEQGTEKMGDFVSSKSQTDYHQTCLFQNPNRRFNLSVDTEFVEQLANKFDNNEDGRLNYLLSLVFAKEKEIAIAT